MLSRRLADINVRYIDHYMSMNSNKHKYDIFVSYSSKDKEAVHQLAGDLSSAGLKVWIDEWEIRVGDPITQKIQQGLENCRYVAIWLTNHAVNSGWVQREWQAKYNKEVSTGSVYVLPLRADDCKIPELLRDKRYSDFRESYADGLNALLSLFGKESQGNAHKTDRDSNESVSPQESDLLNALQSIKEKTSFLWLRFIELQPWSRKLNCEIRESTLEGIVDDLELLSNLNQLSYATKHTYTIPETNERVLQIYIQNISNLLINQIHTVESRMRKDE